MKEIPTTCAACSRPLLLTNLFYDDGCPCNARRGVNFTPQTCVICMGAACVKPGHRIEQLWGPGVLGTWGDRSLPEDDAIDAAFPTRSEIPEQHAIYAEAMRLVGACRSKGRLVSLVNWLLRRLNDIEGDIIA